ncbi:MAG: hypothetical protein WDZ41_04415 [Candidatus Babeliales bacterium]
MKAQSYFYYIFMYCWYFTVAQGNYSPLMRQIRNSSEKKLDAAKIIICQGSMKLMLQEIYNYRNQLSKNNCHEQLAQIEQFLPSLVYQDQLGDASHQLVQNFAKKLYEVDMLTYEEYQQTMASKQKEFKIAVGIGFLASSALLVNQSEEAISKIIQRGLLCASAMLTNLKLEQWIMIANRKKNITLEFNQIKKNKALFDQQLSRFPFLNKIILKKTNSFRTKD